MSCRSVFATNAPPRTIGAHRVRVPDAFYKVLYIESTPVRRYGFLVPHAPSTNAPDAFLTPLTNVEQGTGLEFFRTVTNSGCFWCGNFKTLFKRSLPCLSQW
jgi:DNA/RNA endonuclease G, NUC1